MKILTGIVHSKKMDKTALVEVVSTAVSPIYKKIIRIKKKYPCHDEIGVKNNQKVKIAETRPFSKTKKWKIIEVIK